ncbi:hypothetical protein C4K17_0655 [Pseudomonas chlororaphis subsp. aurantiaca]|nr:hypothetical protein C4K17_0655 [Pseudomonas chlororaphis subsp. aurantiaca]
MRFVGAAGGRLCSRCRRLRSRPKGAQGFKIAEGLRPYRSLRQRLQGSARQTVRIVLL